VETHGPLGVIWVSLGLGAFYIALIWINSLLGVVITPLFVLLGTRVWDMIFHRKPAPPTA
jgi:predicted Na+-dependent transporter